MGARYRSHRRVVLAASCATALLASACAGSGNSNTLTGPTTDPTTENFTGTVPVGGSDNHTFTVALANGQVNITLTQAGPPATIYMGLGVGTPSGSTCSLLTNGSVPTPAGATAQLSGTVAAGTYCVSVYDIGNQTQDVTYSVTVTHY